MQDLDNGHQERLRHQTTLARFGELALKSRDLDEILTEACRLVGDALGTDLAKVLELQADGHTLLVRAGVGWKPGVVGVVTIEIEADTSEAHAIKTGEPMISPDIALETRFRYPPFLIDNGVKAVANVVILGGEGKPPFGVLQIDSRRPREFNTDDTSFLRGYANLIAAAVDRLRILGELRDEQEHLRLAIEAGELGTWAQNLDTGVVVCSRRTMVILGYPGAPPVWSVDSFLTRVLPGDRERIAGAFQKTADAGTDLHFACRFHRVSDGEVRWIELRGRPSASRDGGRPGQLLAIVNDISDRKAIEEALEGMVAERTRELLEANARLLTEAQERNRVEEALRHATKMETVGQLTGGLAHDFNNLLGAISGSLELLRSRANQGRTAEFGRYIDMALASTDRAAGLTHRLLAFSRRQTLDPRPTDVNTLVAGMEALFRNTVGPTVQVRPALADGLWSTLCDVNQLENALLNLVINARDAMPDGGFLDIDTANHTATESLVASGGAPELSPGEYVALIVTDTGCGMTPDVIARAFDPFFTTKPLGQGTGLGMSMVYGFVQQSGGQILLRSKENEGTTVTIYLPRFIAAASDAAGDTTEPAGEIAAGPPEPLSSAVVLVVEDEPGLRMVVVEGLLDMGYTVLEAGDARSGLAIADSETHIDLLVSDVGLPGGMNGRQLADAVRHRRPGLRVLFITGYDEGVVVGKGLLGLGMQVLTKPFTLVALTTRVTEMIGDRSTSPPHAQ